MFGIRAVTFICCFPNVWEKSLVWLRMNKLNKESLPIFTILGNPEKATCCKIEIQAAISTPFRGILDLAGFIAYHIICLWYLQELTCFINSVIKRLILNIPNQMFVHVLQWEYSLTKRALSAKLWRFILIF